MSSFGWREEEDECRIRSQYPAGGVRVVEAEGEHERYRWKREGLRYAIRAGTGTRVLFRVWRERTAIIMCTELLCAYNDGYFVRNRKSVPKGGIEE
jgi:hypothetical protein